MGRNRRARHVVASVLSEAVIAGSPPALRPGAGVVEYSVRFFRGYIFIYIKNINVIRTR